MEATELLGTFRAAGMFLKSSPDLFLHMIQPLAKPWKSLQLKDKPAATLTPRANFNQPPMFCPKCMSGLREEARGPEENQGEQANASGFQGIQTRNLVAVLGQSGPSKKVNH